MSDKIVKNKILCLTKYCHRIIFGVDAGTRTISFAKNLSFSFIGGTMAFGIMFIASIVAARVLGPETYGKYAVVFSIAQMLSMFFVLELDVSALYFLSKNIKEDKDIVASINVMFLVNIIMFTFLGVSIYQLMMPLDISGFAFACAFAMALVFAIKRMVDAFLRIKNKFKKQAISKIAESITVIGVLGVFFWAIFQQEYYSYVIAIILGGVVFIVFGGALVRDMFLVRGATSKNMNTVFRYNIFGIVGATVNSVIKNVDKIVVVAFLGATVGGVYAVYFTASVIVGARMTQLFMNAFFPAVRSSTTNFQLIFQKANILFYKTFIPLIAVASVGVWIIIALYGPQYPVVWYWILLASVYIVVHFFASLYGWLLSSISRDGYKRYNLSFVYGGIAYGLFLLIISVNDLFGIAALLMALILYRVVGGIISFLRLRDIKG